MDLQWYLMPLCKADRPSTSQLCLLIDQFIDALSVHYKKNYALLNFALDSSLANSENRCKLRVQEEKQLINTLPYWRNNFLFRISFVFRFNPFKYRKTLIQFYFETFHRFKFFLLGNN